MLFQKLNENWNHNWNFEKKMHTVLMYTISMIIIIALLISTVSSMNAVIQQSKVAASDQLEGLASEYANNLEQYRSSMVAMIMDTHVQKYCKSKNQKVKNEERMDVYNVLNNMLVAQYQANFLAVVDNVGFDYVYCGNVGISQSKFEEAYIKDYQDSVVAKARTSIHMSYSENYFPKHQYTLTIYFPVYSAYTVNQQIGMLVLNVRDDMFGQISKTQLESQSDLYVTDLRGCVVSNKDEKQIGTTLVDCKQLHGVKGGFYKKGTYFTYQRIGKWNFYLVNQIPLFYLVRNSISAALIMLTSMLILMVIALTLTGSLIKKLFQPMNMIVDKMTEVSEGTLSARISTADMDCDMRKMAEGFNCMMNEIDHLMERVKEEQKQMNQIQLNALHSQIQPHFLYNTLECIHWQAVADGNQDISTLVKALAQYYRICLSDGKDIIPLSKEIEHIQNYIIIQNMRYDNIIQLDINIPKEYENILLPKLTLQPLVENSIYHGIRVKEGRKGIVSIGIREKEGVCIYVSDDGQGIPEETIQKINENLSQFDEKIGYGINNVNKRIELLFGEEYGLIFRPNQEKGLTVEINLPKMDQME